MLQIALKYLKDTEANINNILIIIGNFNVRDNTWDPNFLYHSTHNNLLTNIADSMNLYMSKPTNQVLTRYLDNQNNSNLVIYLMFLRQDSLELDSYIIHLEWKLLSNHIPLTVNIMIIEEHTQIRKHTLVKNSEDKENFITELIRAISKLNTENISSKKTLEQIVQTFANNADRIWFKYSKVINITKYSKA